MIIFRLDIAETPPCAPSLFISGLASKKIAIEPETHAVAAEVPLDHPHQVPLPVLCAIKIGTSCPGATISGFLSGSCLGRIGLGHNLPLLSPTELPLQIELVLVTAPTQITSSTEPGDSTSPSSSSPSFPAAATT